jgi:hypothetical protein
VSSFQEKNLQEIESILVTQALSDKPARAAGAKLAESDLPDKLPT